MKTIFIPINSNFFARNFLRTDAFKILKEKKDLRIVLLAFPSKLDYYEKEFGGGNIVVDSLQETRSSRVEKFFRFVERNSIVTNRVTMDHWTYLFREKKAPAFVRAIRFFFRLINFIIAKLFYLLGHLGKPWRAFVRFAYHLVPAKYYSDLFQKYKPDLIFCPTLVWPEDYCFIREAQKLGLKTVGMIFSWDSFYSKTFFLAKPDFLLVQTHRMEAEARRFADYRGDIQTVGFPQYDTHFKKEGIVPRTEFIKKLGGDPNKKLILYAFSGKAGLDIELDILKILSKAISDGKISGQPEVLIRPYPRFDFSSDKLNSFKRQYKFLGVSSTSDIGADSGADWEMDEEAISLLVNSLAHADVIITMYSTFFIEGAIFDKPLIGIGFDGPKKRFYPVSARRFFDWDHLREIKKHDGILLAKTEDQFIAGMNQSLQNPREKMSGRRRLVEEQCYFTDGLSGRRLANALLQIIYERSLMANYEF